MCEKCQDKGFTEENHGLLMILCDCEAGKKMRAELGLPEVIDDSNSGTEPDNSDTRENYPSEPKQPSKPKKKKKPRKRA